MLKSVCDCLFFGRSDNETCPHCGAFGRLCLWENGSGISTQICSMHSWGETLIECHLCTFKVNVRDDGLSCHNNCHGMLVLAGRAGITKHARERDRGLQTTGQSLWVSHSGCHLRSERSGELAFDILWEKTCSNTFPTSMCMMRVSVILWLSFFENILKII